MLVLLSPAKIMDMESVSRLQIPAVSEPMFLKKTSAIVREMQRLSVDDWMQKLGVSRELAELNFMRYMQFDTDTNPVKPAVLAYDGAVYRKFDAATLSCDSFLYAQDRMLIVSPLYGLLRPLDVIKAYRLAFSFSLPALSAGTLYDYWRTLLTDALVEKAERQGDTIVDLTSVEISRSIDWKRIPAKIKIIRPVFKDRRANGRYQMVAIYSKQARGSMSRFIIDERISDPDDLLAFDADGYYYHPTESTAAAPVFTR